MVWITEENYEEQMHKEVEPYVYARMESGFFEREKDKKLYYEHCRADDPKGVIVISHGFTESVRKFTESAYYMLQNGYDVWGLDHRGHGRSYRNNKNPYVVHVERFSNYVEDLHYLTENMVKPASGDLPIYLYCHSMGGCIGAWTIEKYPRLFKKAVLSSPMLGLSFGKVPVPVVYVAASLKGIGDKKKNALKTVESPFRRSRTLKTAVIPPRSDTTITLKSGFPTRRSRQRILRSTGENSRFEPARALRHASRPRRSRSRFC